MSPYPAQVTQQGIIETAWEMVEEQGSIDKLPLSRLASALGIQAPSLYRHIKNKAELVKRINEHTFALLGEVANNILESMPDEKPLSQLLQVARGFREFAHQHPTAYMLVFSTVDTTSPPEDSPQFGKILNLQNIVGKISGEEQSLTALRGLLAIMHGFVMLELNQQLRRGGDLNNAYEASVNAFLQGWQS